MWHFKWKVMSKVHVKFTGLYGYQEKLVFFYCQDFDFLPRFGNPNYLSPRFHKGQNADNLLNES